MQTQVFVGSTLILNNIKLTMVSAKPSFYFSKAKPITLKKMKEITTSLFGGQGLQKIKRYFKVNATTFFIHFYIIQDWAYYEIGSDITPSLESDSDLFHKALNLNPRENPPAPNFDLIAFPPLPTIDRFYNPEIHPSMYYAERVLRDLIRAHKHHLNKIYLNDF
jgi:hypothetical protein